MPQPASSARRPVLLVLAVALAIVVMALLVARPAGLFGRGESPSTAAPAPTASPPPRPSPPADVHLTIGYAGDVLTHMPVVADTAAGQGDIAPLTAAAQPWVSGVDLALCGMEVPVSPTGSPSGYPMFAAPGGVVAALKDSGWDGCATASNHAWDQGMAGVTATADALEAQGMGFSGTNRTEQEASVPYQLYEIERDGQTITVAQLSSTFNLNGLTADPAWAVNLNDVDWVAAQAGAARQAGADIVVLHSQIGEEYAPAPVAAQTEYAQAVADTGQVDVLFSAHPHVPQTNELLAGGPSGRGMWVSYSAGNFISNQSEDQGTVLAAVGLFVWVDVTVSTDAQHNRTISVDDLHWHAFTVDNAGGHRLIDLAAAAGGEVPDGSTLSLAELQRRWNAVNGVVDPGTYSDEVPVPSGDEPRAKPRS